MVTPFTYPGSIPPENLPAQGLEHPSGSRSGPSSILDRQVLPFWIPDLVIPSIGTFDPIGAGI
ncbi:MAG: hypothetical protein ACKO26_01980, partial [Planctomycetota bacterium]